MCAALHALRGKETTLKRIKLEPEIDVVGQRRIMQARLEALCALQCCHMEEYGIGHWIF